MPTKQDITDWILNWEVRTVASDQDANLVDMVITVDTPSWVELDEGEVEEALEITLGVGAPMILWETLSEDQQEESRDIARRRVYEELILPNWLGMLAEQG